MTLDLQAAQAVVRARLLERAAHDPGPWTVRLGQVTADAVRVKTPSSVRFLVHFEEAPGDAEVVAWLCCRGDEMSSWDLTGALPESGAFTLHWKLSVPEELVRT